MVDDLLKKFEGIVSMAKRDKKELSFFAVVRIDDASDGWSVLASKPGLDSIDARRDLFKYIVDMLVKKLDAQELASVVRVGVFPLEEHLIEDLLKYKKGHIKASLKANGNIIHEAYILESK